MTLQVATAKSAMVVFIAIVLSALSACGSGSSAGPLSNVTTGGQPNFSIASIYTAPGQSADMSAYLVNSAHDPVTLLSANLILIAGHSSGHLVLVGVQAGLGGIAAAAGWPVKGVSIRSLPIRLRYGRSSIIFGFRGSDTGRNYMTAGLKITYRYRGQIYTVEAWSAAVDCVVANPNRAAGSATCEKAYRIAKQATEHLAGA